jgi:gamma-glutamylcyclotransferase (GGCT)/AIG2-like uncharacterized protein YtfP
MCAQASTYEDSYGGWWPYWFTDERKEALTKKFEPKIRDSLCYSPDAAVVQRKQSHYVFIYGEYKKGFAASGIFNLKPYFVCNGLTQESTFQLYQTPNASRALALVSTTNPEYENRIQGELYHIPSSMLLKLDQSMANRVEYFRQKRLITCLSPHGGKSVVAWMYLGVWWHWREKMTGMVKSQKFKRKKFPAYSYQSLTKQFVRTSKSA